MLIVDDRLFFPATQRNRNCIGDVISRVSQRVGTILEIGSGSGEHGVEFQKRFPEITWQTSDPKLLHRKSISAWINYEKINLIMPQPLAIDVEVTPWVIPSKIISSLQGIVSINLIHVISFNCTKSLFKESGKLLKKGQYIMLYGPFKIDNDFTSKSNYLFDKTLKMQNKIWGIRNLNNIDEEGKKNGFIQEEIIFMPANNFSLIYRKIS